MTLDLAYLEDFQALADTRNFSRAAVLRNMTQPAFSRRIRALEDWAGTALFDREVQPVVLTEAGRALLPAAAEAMRCLLQGREAARAAAGRGRTTLHFAATHVLSFSFFPAWLRGLESGQPLDAVQLVSDSLAACEQLMLHGQAQFLLCHHHALAPVRLEEARFTRITVGQDVLCPVVAPDADGRPRYSLKQAGDAVPFLAYSAESGLGRIAATAGLAELALDTVFTSHLAAALRTMAATGRGVAWLPRSLIAEDLSHGRLVAAGPAAMEVGMEIHLIRPITDLGPAAEQFWGRIARPVPA
jgi:DNA-binding transcriptional LysR family regulator